MNTTFSYAIPDLTQAHLDSLVGGSGISPEVIRERGYRSVVEGQEEVLTGLGFSLAQARVPGILIPLHSPDGRISGYQYRPDKPRKVKKRYVKYETPKGASAGLDAPPRCRKNLADPAKPLFLAEGIKKVDALASNKLCALALLGVWNFKGKNPLGGITFLADFDYIALKGRRMVIVYDSDVATKPQVRLALLRLTEHLQRKGADVGIAYLPGGPNGEKVGVDDFLLSHTVAELEALVQAPRPAPEAAAPRVELLDEAPSTLSRPLQLIDGQSYAVTWLWTRETVSETLDTATGEVIRHAPPIVTDQRRMFVVRGDGTGFGAGGCRPLEELGVTIALADPPRDERLWRAASVSAYRAGRLPDPADVFLRVASSYDRFIDFSRSLADQSVMCRLSAAFSLATWFADAFSVLGYPWPNGERGCGKTHWGTTWAHTSYLGEVILSSGTFAAIRDLANYGASLMFDDAEVLANPKLSDPAKRELLLAGNRKGAVIPLKEPLPKGGWATRWVSAYCPRAFTAIRTPDPVLASRSILLPLVRTGDPTRGNADPADPKRWPCDRRGLQDDLWATALNLLPEAKAVWDEFDQEDAVVGREFEPWRAVFAVARLFERHGVTDLEKDMRAVMAAYQRERGDMLGEDRTVLVVRALARLADTKAASTTSDTIQVTASEVANEVKAELVGEESGEEWATPDRVGKILSRLRLTHDRLPDRNRTRAWKLSRSDLAGLQWTYGLTARLTASVQSGQSDQRVQPQAETGGSPAWRRIVI